MTPFNAGFRINKQMFLDILLHPRRLRQLPLKPGLAEAEIAADGLDRYIEQLRRFFSRETTEKAHFDDPRLTGIMFFEPGQGAVQIKKSFGPRIARLRGVFERQLHIATATFAGVAHARVVHQDLPHQLGCHAEKMSAVAVIGLVLPHQPHVCFMNKRSRLKSMVGTLAAKITIGQAPQFGVSHRHQLIYRLLIAILHISRQKPQELCQ